MAAIGRKSLPWLGGSCWLELAETMRVRTGLGGIQLSQKPSGGWK